MRFYQTMPPLADDEYRELRTSIEANGVTVPVIVDEEGNVIDGHHRVTIAQELGISYPTRVIEGLTEEQKIEQSVMLNIARRQLTREQRRSIIATQLKRHPEKSNREHARQLGVSHATVSAVRDRLEESGQIDHFSKREDPRTGNLTQEASRPSPIRTEFHDETAGLHVVDDTDDVEGFIETVDTHIAQSDGDLLRGDDWQAPEPVPAPRVVTGLDGKAYTAKPREATKPRVIDNAADAELDNARTASKRLGSALATLEGFQWAEHRERIITRWWPEGKDVVPPDQRDLFNPEQLRAIAEALQITATELEAQSHE